jgi:hypothetical protein
VALWVAFDTTADIVSPVLVELEDATQFMLNAVLDVVAGGDTHAPNSTDSKPTGRKLGGWDISMVPVTFWFGPETSTHVELSNPR